MSWPRRQKDWRRGGGDADKPDSRNGSVPGRPVPAIAARCHGQARILRRSSRCADLIGMGTGKRTQSGRAHPSRWALRLEVPLGTVIAGMGVYAAVCAGALVWLIYADRLDSDGAVDAAAILVGWLFGAVALVFAAAAMWQAAVGQREVKDLLATLCDQISTIAADAPSPKPEEDEAAEVADGGDGGDR